MRFVAAYLCLLSCMTVVGVVGYAVPPHADIWLWLSGLSAFLLLASCWAAIILASPE